MKNAQNLVSKVAQVWSFALLAIVVVSIAFAIVQVATGNVNSTTAFEF